MVTVVKEFEESKPAICLAMAGFSATFKILISVQSCAPLSGLQMAWLFLLALTSFLFLFTVLFVFLRKLIQLSSPNSKNLKKRTRNIPGKNVNNASSQMKQFSCTFFHPNW